MSLKNQKKILITGASGFLGKKLVESYQTKKNICLLDRKYHSLFEIESLEDLVSDAEIIYHFAGVNSGSGYQPKLEELNKNNIDATYNLIKAIKKYCKRPPTLVLTSSIHVYDKVSKIFSENDQLSPNSSYGMSKLSQEILINQATQMGIIKSVIFRASNIYGPGCRPNYNSAISTFCYQVKNQEEIPLYANGKATLDLIYIDDVIKVLRDIKFFLRSGKNTFNLASGRTVPINEIISNLAEISGQKIKTKLIDTPLLEFKISTKLFKSVYPNFKLHNIKDGIRVAYESVN
ncbi:MAG: SDR family oxidoreductase [Gammaproteobacteria bacterium]|nr:SDR family oxidoreductase [Gammaproteobacteria bacterium]